MFRQLRNALIGLPQYPDEGAASNGVLSDFRPSQLSEYLEGFWSSTQVPGPKTTPPFNVGHFVGEDLADAERLAMARTVQFDNNVPVAPTQINWHHLAYAYILENTRVYDIFSKVLSAYANGEKLPPATPATQRWLRATEELFFTNPRPYSIRSVTSSIRPDAGAVRRNAYYRLLGMDLNHGAEDGRPYPFQKPQAANRDFPALFEEFLREVWKAYMNRRNFIGPRATDDEAIRLLVVRLREMLNSRRLGGMLLREEFDAVATLSWFHLALEGNTQIVIDLDAQASSPAERLQSIGARVGLPAHSRADASFRMAEPMSHVLLDIENSTIEANPQDLYQDMGVYTQDMLTIITQWSIATGRNIKEAVGVRGTLAPVGGSPVRAAFPATQVSGNGGARRSGVAI